MCSEQCDRALYGFASARWHRWRRRWRGGGEWGGRGNNAAGPRNVKWGRGAGGLKVSAGNEASRENTFIFCDMNNLPYHRHCTVAPPPLHPCIMFFFIAGKGVGGKMRREDEIRGRWRSRGRDGEDGCGTGERAQQADVPQCSRSRLCSGTQPIVPMAPGCLLPMGVEHLHTSMKGVVDSKLTFCTFNTRSFVNAELQRLLSILEFHRQEERDVAHARSSLPHKWKLCALGS